MPRRLRNLVRPRTGRPRARPSDAVDCVSYCQWRTYTINDEGESVVDLAEDLGVNRKLDVPSDGTGYAWGRTMPRQILPMLARHLLSTDTNRYPERSARIKKLFVPVNPSGCRFASVKDECLAYMGMICRGMIPSEAYPVRVPRNIKLAIDDNIGKDKEAACASGGCMSSTTPRTYHPPPQPGIAVHDRFPQHQASPLTANFPGSRSMCRRRHSCVHLALLCDASKRFSAGKSALLPPVINCCSEPQRNRRRGQKG